MGAPMVRTIMTDAILAAALIMNTAAGAASSSPPPLPATTPAPTPTTPDSVRAPAAPAICVVRAIRLERSRPAEPAVETSAATVAGALTYTRLDVDIDGATLQQALMAVARAARVNIVGTFKAGNTLSGLDRLAPVYLSLHDVTAIEAIEQILASTSGMIDATWQIRGTIVECGPKSMLAEPSRRVVRVHDITDIRFEVPMFAPPAAAQANPGLNRRRSPKEICADLARLVMHSVEPQAWEEPPPSDEPAGNSPATPPMTPTTPSAPAVPSRNLDGYMSRNDIYVNGKWASMHFRDDRTLVVTAPDFIHRQLGGYGELIPPPPLSE